MYEGLSEHKGESKMIIQLEDRKVDLNISEEGYICNIFREAYRTANGKLAEHGVTVVLTPVQESRLRYQEEIAARVCQALGINY